MSGGSVTCIGKMKCASAPLGCIKSSSLVNADIPQVQGPKVQSLFGVLRNFSPLSRLLHQFSELGQLNRFSHEVVDSAAESVLLRLGGGKPCQSNNSGGRVFFTPRFILGL